MTLTTVLVGVVIAIGLVGVVVPVLPGSVLVAGAILVWAIEVGTTTGWVVLGLALALLVVGAVVKYAVPGRRLKRDGIPARTLLLGGLLGVVGFFVVPVIGLPLGFVLGVYASERQRLRAHAPAWTATKAALKQVGVSMLIEFLAGLAAALTWSVGVVLS